MNMDTIHPNFTRTALVLCVLESSAHFSQQMSKLFPKVIKILHFCNAYEYFGFLIVEGNIWRARTMNNPPKITRN